MAAPSPVGGARGVSSAASSPQTRRCKSERAALELRFVRHLLGERMAECVFGIVSVSDLIDEFRLQRVASRFVRSSNRSNSSARNRAPMTAAAFNVRFAEGVSRSIRSPMGGLQSGWYMHVAYFA